MFKKILILVLIIGLGHQTNADQVKVETYIDAPYTLDQVREFAKKPEFEAKITKREDDPFVSRCAHSPICVLHLPFYVIDQFIDKIWYEVEIKKSNKLYLVGRFNSDGDLIHARLYQGDRYSDIKFITLSTLNRLLLVKYAEGKMEGDIALESKPVPIITQVDLLKEYRQELNTEDKQNRRKRMVKEALSWLGKDAEKLMMERLQDNKENTEIKEIIIDAACREQNTGQQQILPVRHVLDSIKHTREDDLIEAALQCYKSHPYNVTGDAGEFLAILSKNYCSDKKVDKSILDNVKNFLDTPDLIEISRCAHDCNNHQANLKSKHVQQAIKDCQLPARQARLKQAHLLAISEKEMTIAFNSRDKLDHTLFLIDETKPEKYRSLYMSAIQKQDEYGKRALKRLAEYSSGFIPNEKELEQLTDLYFRDDHRSRGVLFMKTDEDFAKREMILKIFRRAHKNGIKLDNVKSRFLDDLKGENKIDTASVEIGLVVMGENNFLYSALKSAGIKAGDSLHGVGDADNNKELVFNSIITAGCSIVKIQDMMKKNADAQAFASLECLKI